MRTYEMMLVFDPALEVEQIDMDLRKLQDYLAAHGSVRRWERWGKRRLSYEIKGRQYGYYVLSVFDSEASAVNELDRSLRIMNAVIRHLITIVDAHRVPEADPESVRTLGAAPEAPVAPVVAETSAETAAVTTEQEPVAEKTEDPESDER